MYGRANAWLASLAGLEILQVGMPQQGLCVRLRSLLLGASSRSQQSQMGDELKSVLMPVLHGFLGAIVALQQRQELH
jgi:hypothetical protein